MSCEVRREGDATSRWRCLSVFMAKKAKVSSSVTEQRQLRPRPVTKDPDQPIRSQPDSDMSWGYGQKDGPSTWAENFPDANGPRQSPVDIVPGDAQFERSLANNPITINYNEEPDLEVENPGLSFKVNIKADSTITGGPLGNAKYKLVQFHFHWGHDDDSGSEHTVNGKMYASELHLVHYNTEKYASFAEAVTHSDGLSVIGVFIRVAPGDHKGFQTLAENAEKVKCKASKVSTGQSFNPVVLLPGNTSKYWTYEGSLTTPPCCESVRWIVLKDEITISPEQIRSMRNLCCDDCGKSPIPANFRPPLPLGSREIQASFQ
ncbi:carbonic anhydrase [Plakobranchus ocellatus]|uniref:Carbonic anhydrase n=1 Tax=Plakobranchus ocellatus TaxID=259542 RepID=A0AAV3ZCF2_9GAST|nr:carbonic anhydrase [Plakobranchus ocellatus]